jgi:hypothetical protein
MSRNKFPNTNPMKPTTKIRFTEPQIALMIRAYPNCNLDHLIEVSFEFDQAGNVIECIPAIKVGENIDHNCVLSGLARLYEIARRQRTSRQTSATILQFPNGERLADGYPRQGGRKPAGAVSGLAGHPITPSASLRLSQAHGREAGGGESPMPSGDLGTSATSDCSTSITGNSLRPRELPGSAPT